MSIYEEISMKRIHIAIAVADITASVADYSQRLDCQPCVVVAGEYALWRTDTINFSIRQTGEAVGLVRHLGWEDDSATVFSKEVDVNGLVWERFNAENQAAEIKDIWSNVDYQPNLP
jgi:hypothetical protein